MESSVPLAIHHFPCVSYKHNSSRNHHAVDLTLCPRIRSKITCQKMYVPGFGDGSPEAKAANNLHNFFTFVAVQIVMAQLEDYNSEAHKDMKDFVKNHSLNDGDKFCAELMRESPSHQQLALRILEVRNAYCKNDFEWDNLQKLAVKMVRERNTKLMRDYVVESTRIDPDTL